MQWFNEIPAFVQVSLGICTAIISFSGAVAAVVKLFKWMRKPTDELVLKNKETANAIRNNQDEIKNIQGLLQKDLKRFEEIEKDKQATRNNFAVVNQALIALLDHAITNNSTGKCERARDRLLSHVVES